MLQKVFTCQTLENILKPILEFVTKHQKMIQFSKKCSLENDPFSKKTLTLKQTEHYYFLSRHLIDFIIRGLLAGTTLVTFLRETLFLILCKNEDSVGPTPFGRTYQLTNLNSSYIIYNLIFPLKKDLEFNWFQTLRFLHPIIHLPQKFKT